MENYQNSQPAMKTVTGFGIILKSLIGIIIVFAVAMPRILAGEILFQGLMGLLLVVVLGILWFVVFRSLMVDKGPIVNLIVYMFACFLLGLFFSNTIAVSIYYISFYANGAVDAQLISQALTLAAFATMVAVVGGIIVLPRIKLTGKVARIGLNLMPIFSAILIGYGILYFIAFILALFGATGLLNALMGLVFGIGNLSIGLSVIAVLFAEALFLASAARVKMMIGTEPKYLEYYGAVIIVNAVIQIFVEIFKLVLKILARRNQN